MKEVAEERKEINTEREKQIQPKTMKPMVVNGGTKKCVFREMEITRSAAHN